MNFITSKQQQNNIFNSFENLLQNSCKKAKNKKTSQIQDNSRKPSWKEIHGSLGRKKNPTGRDGKKMKVMVLMSVAMGQPPRSKNTSSKHTHSSLLGVSLTRLLPLDVEQEKGEEKSLTLSQAHSWPKEEKKKVNSSLQHFVYYKK